MPWNLPSNHLIMPGPYPTAQQHLPTRWSPGQDCGTGRRRAALAWVTERTGSNNRLDCTAADGIWRECCLRGKNKTELLGSLKVFLCETTIFSCVLATHQLVGTCHMPFQKEYVCIYIVPFLVSSLFFISTSSPIVLKFYFIFTSKEVLF